jgi:hypothetical protein
VLGLVVEGDRAHEQQIAVHVVVAVKERQFRLPERDPEHALLWELDQPVGPLARLPSISTTPGQRRRQAQSFIRRLEQQRAPSELPCSRSISATTGFEKSTPNRTRCLVEP